MADFSLSKSFLIFFKKSLIVPTSELEKREEQLKIEYREFFEFSDSQELADYLELEEYVNSREFQEFKDKIEKQKFQDTDAYQKEVEYKRLKKSSNIKNYYKLRDSQQLSNLKDVENSQDLERFEELEKFVISNEFLNAKQEMKGAEFKQSEEYQKFQEHKRLKKDARLKGYFKLKKSPKYDNYVRLDGSKEIENYEELKAYVESQEFTDLKNKIKTQKFRDTEAFQKQQQYLEKKKSPQYVKYFKLKESNDFDQLDKWELTFEDDFEQKKLDTDKWLTGFYWGKKLINDNYSLATDKHFYTAGKNIEIGNSVCKITTKKENVKGKVWDSQFGFKPNDFEYSSGIINTGESFRQKYGLFKAKVKVNHAFPVYHAFWMLGAQNVPEIDVLKFDAKKPTLLSTGAFWKNGSKDVKHEETSVGGFDFSSDFLIYSLEWTKDKLEWKINDIVVRTQTQNVPKEEMYVLLSSGLSEDADRLPSTMEIDWVRCYKLKD